MKNIENMTLKEAIDEFFKMMITYMPDNDDNDRFEELYEKIIDETEEIVVYQHNFTATITVVTEDEEYEGTTNLISGDFFEAWKDFDCDYPEGTKGAIYSANHSSVQSACATFSLAKIQEELTDEVLETVFKGHHIVSFDYFLANPRKDVVEWALKHKDELGLNKIKPEFIEEYQAIPELKALILKELGKKGE